MVTLNVNVNSMNAQRLVNINQANLAKTTQRLSSGMRINTASDDPAGVGIAQTLTSQVRGDTMASNQNIQQGHSMLQVTDSALNQISDALQRMRELAVEGSNASLTTNEQNALDAEFQSLKTAIDNIAAGVQFNGKVLLDGSTTTVTLQTGWQQTSSSALDFSTAYTTAGLGLTAGISIGSTAGFAGAQAAQTTLDTAIQTVSTARANFGAQDQALSALQGALDSSIVATTDARSHITDADMAQEVSNLVRQQLLQQAGASALSSANFSAQFIVKLLT
jgi:flagellin